MALNPKVSIIIPVYNGSNYMREAIDSALDQTYDDTEVIVVNDGSRDHGLTDLTARQYGDRIRYICKENGGVASALNAGIAEAQGDYVSWLSHDDVYLPQKIERQVNALREIGRPAVVVCNVRSIDGKGHFLRDHILSERISLSTKCFLALEAETGINGCALLLPKEGLRKHGGFRADLKTTQDYDMWFKLSDEYEFLYIRDILVLSRQHDAQDSRQKTDICLKESDELHARFIRNISHGEIDHFFSGDTRLLWRAYTTYKNAGYKATAVQIFKKLQYLLSEKPCDGERTRLLDDEILQFGTDGQPSEIIQTLKDINDLKKPRKPRIMYYANVWFRGGMERVIANLTARLQEHYSIFLVSMENREYPEGFPLQRNVQHIRISAGENPQSLAYRLALLASLLDIDIFIGNPNILVEFLGVYDLMHDVGIRTIAFNHYNFFLPLQTEWLYPVARERIRPYKNVEVVVWMTSFSTAAYSQLLPNGATMPNPNSFPVQKGNAHRLGKVIIAVGRFYDYIKRVDYIFDVFRSVLNEHPDAKLLLVGGYDMNLTLPERGGQNLHEFINSLSLPPDSYRFEGEQERVERYYEQASVLIQTSSSEGFSLVLNEAGCFGVPSVIFEVPGLEDLITDGENGFVVPQGDTASMARRVTQLLNDTFLREGMSAKSQRMAQRFDTDLLCERWNRLFSTVLSNPDKDALNRVLREQFQFSEIDTGKLHAAVVNEYERSVQFLLSSQHIKLGGDLKPPCLTDAEYQKLSRIDNDEVKHLLSKVSAAYEQLNRNQILVENILKIVGHPVVRYFRPVYRKLFKFMLLVDKFAKKCLGWLENVKRGIKTAALQVFPGADKSGYASQNRKLSETRLRSDSLRIAYVSYEDIVGRRFNGYDLSLYYNSNGDQCAMYVLHRQSPPEALVFEVWPYPVRRRIRNLGTKIEEGLSIQNMLYPPALFYRKYIRHADVLHFQHISHAYLNLLEMLILSRQKPCILSVHDFSNFSGHCANPPESCEAWIDGCESCPNLSSIFALRRNTAHVLWKYKKSIWTHCNMDIVVASRWMLERVNKSPFYSHCEKHLIPFGVNLDVFYPRIPREARREIGIPSDCLAIMFRGLDAPAKGLVYLRQALERIRVRKTPVYLIIVNGSGFFNELKGKFGIKEISVVTDEKEMATLYQAADVFLSPSLQETFGMMSVEAMACGIPGIVTEDTPLPEVTRAPEATLVVPKRNPDLLARAIDRLLDDVELRNKLGSRGRALAVELYDFKNYAKRMRELYIYTLEKRKAA